MRPAVLAVRAMHCLMTIEAGAPAAPEVARQALEVYRPCQGVRSDVQQQGYSYSGPGVRAVRAMHAPMHGVAGVLEAPEVACKRCRFTGFFQVQGQAPNSSHPPYSGPGVRAVRAMHAPVHGEAGALEAPEVARQALRVHRSEQPALPARHRPAH